MKSTPGDPEENQERILIREKKKYIYIFDVVFFVVVVVDMSISWRQSMIPLMGCLMMFPKMSTAVFFSLVSNIWRGNISVNINRKL